MKINTYNLESFVGRLRKKANLKQVELGEMIGISQSSICMWECHVLPPGTKRMKQLIEIGQKYGIKTSLAALRKEYGVE